MPEPYVNTVAVVIPVHNGARFLAETLLAVGAQTHGPLDIIVVDDASTDDSVDVALATGVPLRLLRNSTAGGASHARNTGLGATTADFVCFMDQDDIWHPQHLTRQLSVFAAQPTVGAVVSPYQHWYPGDTGYPSAAYALPARSEVETDVDFSGWVYHQFLRDCWALTSDTLMLRQAVVCVHGVVLPRLSRTLCAACTAASSVWSLASRHGSRMADPRHQARRRRVGDERVNRAVHEVPQIATLAQACLVNAEAARQELVTAQRACGPGDFSLQHDAAQRLLGGIVGRRQARIRRERPQRRPQLEDVGAGVGRAAALLLPRATLQRRSHSPLQPFELVADQLALVAPAEHDQTQPEQPAPDTPGRTLTLPDPIEVAQQMNPADLPALVVDERIAGIPVRRDHCGALLADEVQDHVARPRRVDGEHRQQRLHRRPDPVVDALARVVRLVHPQRIGAAQRSRRFGHRRLQRMSDLAVRLRDGAHAETQAHQLIKEVANLALREVIPRAQHAHQRRRARPQLTLGHPGGQNARMRLAAACAAAAVEAIFVDLGAQRRHFEHLVALRRAGQLDLATTLTNRLGHAFNKPVHLGFVEQGPTVALVPRLRAALAIADAALHPIELAGPVRRRRLGGVVGIQIDALFKQLHAFNQQGDDGVALGHGLRKLRQPSVGWGHRQNVPRLDLHRGSIPIKSATCNEYFKPAAERDRHSISGVARYPVNTYQAVVDCEGFDETLPFSEDWDLWLRLARQVPFAKLNWPPVLYRQHAVQGSRKARPVDYRCQLLLFTAANHGLASRDGRHVPRAEFNRIIARFEADFGYTQLLCGDAALGVRKLLRAWRRRPTAMRPPALALAAALGWRPSGHVLTSDVPTTAS